MNPESEINEDGSGSSGGRLLIVCPSNNKNSAVALPDGPAQDISILYVEDDDLVRKEIGFQLKHYCEKVFLARNGLEGFEAYLKIGPDIVITDIQMPVMDGLTMARKIRALDANARIIVTTSYGKVDYLMELINMGINHCILKPIERDKLDQAMGKCIREVLARKSSDVLQKHIADAYRTIDTFMDCGEKGTKVDPAIRGSEDNLDLMVETLLHGNGEAGFRGPEMLVMTISDSGRSSPKWYCYELSNDGSFIKHLYPEPPELDLPDGDTELALHYVNMDDPLPLDPHLMGFVRYFASYGKRTRNLVWYLNGSCIVCAVNYPRRVTSYDALVVKSLAVHSLHMENLYSQFAQTEEAFAYTITSLARAAEANDEDTGNHIVRVGQYCAAIARHMGFSEKKSIMVGLQSQLHDVGKIHVPLEILRKPGKLAESEMNVMREHTIFGARIIGSHPRLELARTMALYHHECWDGSGYPYGLSGSQIPLEARILCLADTYDALRSSRSYKPTFDHATACRIICEGDGRTSPAHFDPEVLRAFNKLDSGLEEIYQRFAALSCASKKL
jgi:response regulator RpfG family c-di-GMP phosphodiesterase